MYRATAVAVLLANLVVIGAPVGAAVPVVSIDSGRTDRAWLVGTKPGTDEVAFVWLRSLPLDDAIFFLIGECIRFDQFGLPTGANKVTFKNIVLIGAESGNEVPAATAAERLVGGVQRDLVTWVLTDAARALFRGDTAVLVTGNIKVSKRVDAFDEVMCELAVGELLETGGQPLAAQSFDGGLPIVRGVELPRLLTTPQHP